MDVKATSRSPSQACWRLRKLRDGRLVDLVDGEGYGLSSLGNELLERFLPIMGWSQRWAKALPK